MPFKSIKVESFHGLRLDADPLELGWDAAADGWNFDLSPDGLLKPRLGFELHDLSSTHFVLPTLLYSLPNANRLMVADGFVGSIDVYDNAGTLVASNTAGTPTTTNTITAVDANNGTYVSDGAAPRFINSSGAISVPAFTGHTPSGEHMAITPLDGRLVVNDGADRIRFSNAGTPTTFNTDDWLDLNPGDGERIRSIVTWREFVFIFKQTNAWVYYGTSVDTTGGAVFEVRPIANIPAVFPGGMPVAVGRDGVYYLGRGGIYVTTGSTPRKISQALDPVFSSLSTQQSVSSPNPGKPDYTVPSRPYVYWADDRLYIAYATEDSFSTNDRIAVWDQRLDEWMIWRRDTIADTGLAGVSAITTQPINSSDGLNPQLLIAMPEYTPGGIQPPTPANVASMTNASALDDSLSFAWSYVSGYTDFGSVAEKVARRTDIYGTGNLRFNLNNRGARSGDSVDIGGIMNLGFLDNSRQVRYKPIRGRQFAFEINGNTDELGIINRIEQFYAGPTRSS